MSKIRLTYFDIDGGRAETARVALAIAGIDFEDRRITFPQFGELRATFPLGCVPILEIDGETYTQGNAMSRYYGKLAGLYPEDPWQAFLCDEIMETMEDVSNALGKTFGLEGEAFKAARESAASGMFTRALRLLAKRLQKAGDYFADNRLTVADLKVSEWVRMLNSGNFDHIPIDLVQREAPALLAHSERVMAHPGVSAYYKKRAQQTQ